MKDFRCVTSPLTLIATKREELNAAYRKVYNKKAKRFAQAQYWLPIWIKKYDDAIKVLKENESGPWGCKCKTLQNKMLGDGCEICNPEMAKEIEEENAKDLDN